MKTNDLEHYSTKEIAYKLHVHENTVTSWRNNGKLLPDKKIGRMHLYERQRIDILIQSGALASVPCASRGPCASGGADGIGK